MAFTYGTITYAKLYGVSSTGNAYQVRTGYELVSQEATGTSKFKLRLQVRTVNSNYYTYGYTQVSTLAGQQQSAKSFSLRTVNEWVTFGEITITVTHDDKGDFSGKYGASFKTNVDETYALLSGSASVTVTLPNIPRRSGIGIIDPFHIEEGVAIPITKYVDTFTDVLTVSLLGQTIKTVNGISNGDKVTFTSNELEMIYGLLPSTTQGSFTFTLTSHDGENVIGSTNSTATGLIPESIIPTPSFVVQDEESDIAEFFKCFIKGKSRLFVDASGSVGGSGASVVSCKITVGNESFVGDTASTNELKESGSLIVSVAIEDTRGRRNTKEETYRVVDYSLPYIESFRAVRSNSSGVEDNSGTYAKVTLVGGVSSIDGKNTHEYKVLYKKTSETTWNELVIENEGNTINKSVILSNIESGSSYDVKGYIADYFTSAELSSKPVPSSFRTMNFLNGGKGVAFGKLAEEEIFECEFPAEFNNGLEAQSGITNIGEPPIKTKNIVGIDVYGNDSDLRIQYGQNKKVILGNNGGHSISEDGSEYTGVAKGNVALTGDEMSGALTVPNLKVKFSQPYIDFFYDYGDERSIRIVEMVKGVLAFFADLDVRGVIKQNGSRLSLRGANTTDGSLVQLWSGASKTPSFTVENIEEYKYFLVQCGNQDSTIACWIFVPYSPSVSGGVFRGIGGYENANTGAVIFSIRGTVSDGTISIDDCYQRGSKSTWTGTNGTQMYIKNVYGVK